MSVVYAQYTRLARIELWNTLRQGTTTILWIVGGNFNDILHASEKIEGFSADI